MVIVHTPGIWIMIATNSPPLKSRLPVKASNNFSLFLGTCTHPRQSAHDYESKVSNDAGNMVDNDGGSKGQDDKQGRRRQHL